MMHLTVNSVTLERLRAFRSRRVRLIALRGVCVTVLTLLAAMSLVALLDYLIVLPDKVRWALTAAGYAVAFAVAWFRCLRLILRAPSDRQLAQLMETTRPELREYLLSAVELGVGTADAEIDSQAFRQLLQDSVTERVSGLRAAQLLPWRLVRGWMLGAAAVVAIMIALLAILGAPFRNLLARAYLPSANVARISHVQVTIVEPTPHDATVPQNETLPVVVDISGPTTDAASVEIRSATGATQLVALERQADRRFAGRLDVGTESFQYRVFSGDAVTKYYRVTPRPRPYIATFEKVYHYPDYAALKDAARTEPHGNLEAIEGTMADLTLHSNQPVTAGELRLAMGQVSQTIPLSVVAPDTVRGSVKLTASGTYTVHVVGAETRFANRLSPQYEIKVLPDQPPRVELTAPADHRLLGPQDVVAVRGTATDDLGLASIVQEVRVNERPPVRLALVEVTGRTANFRQAWDLLPLKLNAGDRIVTKLIATDRKGNSGESAAISATVVSAGLDGTRLASLAAQQRVSEELVRLAAAIERQREATLKALDGLHSKAVPEAQQKLNRMNAIQGNEQLPRDFDRVLRIVVAETSKVSAGAEAHGLMAIGQTLALVQLQVLSRNALLFERATATDAGPGLVKSRNDILANYRLATDTVTRAALGIELFVADESVQIAQDLLHDLARDESRAAAESSSPDRSNISRERLNRLASVATEQCAMVEQLLSDAAARMHDREVPKIVHALAERRTALEKAMEKPIAEPAAQRDVIEKSAKLDGAIAQAVIALQPVGLRLARGVSGTREELHRRAGLLRDRVRGLDAPWRDTLGRHHAANNSIRRGETPAQAKLLEYEAPLALGIIKARMDLEAARRDADWRYVADLGLAYRALNDLVDRVADQNDSSNPDAKPVPDKLATNAISPDSVARLTAAFAVLDAAHDIAEVVRAERDLRTRERWASQAAAAHTLHPRQWDFASGRVVEIAPQMRPLGFSREAMDLLTAIPQRPYTLLITERMAERRRSTTPPPSVLDELALADADLYAVLQLMLPKITESRTILEQAAPTAIQMLRQLAVRTGQLQRETLQVVQTPDGTKPSAPLDQHASAAYDKLEIVRRKMGVALDALRADANLQDVLTQQGRDFARDVDDAVMTLTDRANRTRNAFAAAREAEQQSAQRDQLKTAAERELELSAALAEAADHFERLQRGETIASSREKLRTEEVHQGQREKLQDREERLADLNRKSELAASDPRKLLNELEQELKQNRIMHVELDAITRQLLRQARADLNQAAVRERQVATSSSGNTELQASIFTAAVHAATDVARAGRHERRLGNLLLADRVDEIAKDVARLPGAELPDLARQLVQSPQPPKLHDEIVRMADAIQQQADRIGKLLNEPDATDTESKADAPPDASADQHTKKQPPKTPPKSATESVSANEPPPVKPAEEKGAKIAEALKKQRDPETSRWLARALDELDESLLTEEEKKKYESLTATAGDKSDDPMMPTQTPDQNSQKPMSPPKPKSDEQTQAKDHDNPPMPPSPPADSKGDGPGNGNSGTGPGGPPVPGLKPPKGKAKKAKSMFFESTEFIDQEIDQDRFDEEEPETKDDPGESLGTGGSGGPAGSRRPHGSLSAVERRESGTWGKLPPQTARDLNEGSRQEVDGAYRLMVESYFRAIAERAKERSKP